jgi:hypothetical protein
MAGADNVLFSGSAPSPVVHSIGELARLGWTVQMDSSDGYSESSAEAETGNVGLYFYAVRMIEVETFQKEHSDLLNMNPVVGRVQKSWGQDIAAPWGQGGFDPMDYLEIASGDTEGLGFAVVLVPVEPPSASSDPKMSRDTGKHMSVGGPWQAY